MNTATKTADLTFIPHRIAGYKVSESAEDGSTVKIWIDPNQDSLVPPSPLTVAYHKEADAIGFWEFSEDVARAAAPAIVMKVNEDVIQNTLPDVKRAIRMEISKSAPKKEIRVIWQRKFSQMDVATLMYVWSMKRLAERERRSEHLV